MPRLDAVWTMGLRSDRCYYAQPPEVTDVPTALGGAAAPALETTRSRGGKLNARCKDGYRVSGALVAFGTALEAIGAIGAIGAALIVLLGMAAAQSLPVGGFLGGILVGGIWFALFFVSGILVSAQGQILRATLDSPVNSSPFLTDEERIVAMDLT